MTTTSTSSLSWEPVRHRLIVSHTTARTVSQADRRFHGSEAAGLLERGAHVVLRLLEVVVELVADHECGRELVALGDVFPRGALDHLRQRVLPVLHGVRR